jgi:lactate permease
VAFGAIAIPIVTLSGLTEIPKEDLGAMVGRQTPLLALFVPLILVGMVDGWRGVKAVWPAAVVGGLSFAIGQFVCSNYVSVELTDIVASLLSIGAMVGFLRVWQPGTPLVAERRERGGPMIAGAASADAAHEGAIRRREGHGKDSRGEIIAAYAPYLIIIVVFGLSQWGPIKDFIAKGSSEFTWPGLDILNAKGEAPSAVTYKLNWLPAAGTLLLICGLLTMAYLRISPGAALRAYGRMLDQLKWATLTVAAVLALAYVMNHSRQTITIGLWIAGAGGILGFLSPIIGWLGVAVTGSDTSSNSLFGVLQVQAAKEAGLDPTLLAAANSSGGVLGKMVSPQNLAIGAAAVGMGGQEGELFRRVLGWSLLLLLIMCVLVYLQTTAVLSWMVV